MVEEINSAGGNITQDDFAAYTIEVQSPISTYYHGYKILTANAPFGGPLALFILNLLELYNLPTRSYDADTIHLIVETFKWAFSNRMALVCSSSLFVSLILDNVFCSLSNCFSYFCKGDPAFVNISFVIQQLLRYTNSLFLSLFIFLIQTDLHCISSVRIMQHRFDPVSILYTVQFLAFSCQLF